VGGGGGEKTKFFIFKMLDEEIFVKDFIN